MKKKTYHLILILGLLVCQKGKACFCISEDIETANYSTYEELFLGKILNIERIAVSEIRGKEKYEYVGTITTFEVIKKWKGSNKKIIKIYQQESSCGLEFSITNSRWIISAYRKSFVTEVFRKIYPDKYLQTDNCSLYVEELDYDGFENDIKKIDKKFPNEIELKNDLNYGLYIMVLILGIGMLIILKKRK